MMQVIFFDLDGTLTSLPSFEKRFVYYLWKKGLLPSCQLIPYLSFLFQYFRQYKQAVFHKNKSYLTGLSIDTVRGEAEQFVNQHLFHLLRLPVYQALQSFQKQNLKTILLTGTPDFLALPISQKLYFDDFIATIPASENGHYMNAPPIQHPFEKEKWALAKQYCQENGFPLDEIGAFADSNHDLPFLLHLQNVVLVHPHRKLKKIGLQKKWMILKDCPKEKEPRSRY